MTEDDALKKFGLPAAVSALPEIRDLLRMETDKERRSQGHGSTELMKLLCVHLFFHGLAEDVLLIWGAKSASFDADASIDVPLLCGAGLEATVALLENAEDPAAANALARVRECVAAGDFEDFSPEAFRAFWLGYYSH